MSPPAGWLTARSIGRELTRNRSPDGAYFPSQAQGRADPRRRAAKRPWKLEGVPMEDYVRDKLGQYWSAEAVIASTSTNRWRADHLAP
jgi:IS30 family transposase